MFEGFILIGGKSSRMGKDKFALKLNNKTFLQIASETLQKAGIEKTLVAISEQTKFDFTYPTVTDIYQNRGALSGIHSALFNTKSDFIVILACDYPFVSAELINFLKNISITNPQFEAIVPVQPDNKIQPLCAVYQTQTCRNILSEMLAQETENYSVRDFLEKLNVRYIDFSEIAHLPNAKNFFFNVNSPEDFEKAKMIAENSEVQIEKMQIEDLEKVLKIQYESNLSYWSYESYKEEINQNYSFTIVAKSANQTVGFLVGRFINEEKIAELYNIGVDNDFRRKNVGTKLIESFIKACQLNNLDKLFLEVRESNQTAIEFYRKHDFAVISKRKNFYTRPPEDAIIMVKEISSAKQDR